MTSLSHTSRHHCHTRHDITVTHVMTSL